MRLAGKQSQVVNLLLDPSTVSQVIVLQVWKLLIQSRWRFGHSALSVFEAMNSMDCSDVAGGNEVRTCNSDNVIIAPVSEELDTLLKQVWIGVMIY